MRCTQVKKLLAVLIVLTSASFAEASDDVLNLGLNVGYNSISLRSDANDDKADGGTMRLSASYRFNEYIGATLSYGASWHQGYSTIEKVEGVDETGEAVTILQKKQTYDLLVAHQVATGLIYVIDILKVIPFFEFSLVNIWLTEIEEQGAKLVYDFAARLSVGFDFYLNEKVSIGALVGQDIILTRQSKHDSLTNLLARISYSFAIKRR